MNRKKLKETLASPCIFKVHGKLALAVRIRDLVLTVALWAGYIYLLQDFFTFLGDIYHWLHDGDGTAKAYPKLRIFQTLEDYSSWLLLMATVFIVWALYNRLRFRNKTRRKVTEPVTVNDLGKMFHLEPKDLKKWQASRSLTVHHKAGGVTIE